MTTHGKAAVVLAGGATWLLVLGFVLFAAHVGRPPDKAVTSADGIVVLTGGPVRIAEAARLLRDHRGERLLISGVNVQINRDTIQRLTKLAAPTFDCCVDLDYAALDTVGNATETRKWVALHHYDRLIVVTSRLHMPRSLAELGRALPGVELVPHRVAAHSDSDGPWWLNPRTMQVMVSEYVKFLPAAARLIMARAFGPWDMGTVTASGAKPPLAQPPLAKTSGL